MADAGDLKSSGGNTMRVRVPPPAPTKKRFAESLSGYRSWCSTRSDSLSLGTFWGHDGSGARVVKCGQPPPTTAVQLAYFFDIWTELPERQRRVVKVFGGLGGRGLNKGGEAQYRGGCVMIKSTTQVTETLPMTVWQRALRRALRQGDKAAFVMLPPLRTYALIAVAPSFVFGADGQNVVARVPSLPDVVAPFVPVQVVGRLHQGAVPEGLYPGVLQSAILTAPSRPRGWRFPWSRQGPEQTESSPFVAGYLAGKSWADYSTSF